MDPATLALLAGCASNVVFDAGERLFVEGDPADRFWIVRHGQVGLEVTAPGAGQLIIETLGPGAVVGWSWLVAPYRWSFDAVAQETTRAVVVRRGLPAGQDGLRSAWSVTQLMGRFLPIVVDRLQATRLRLLDLYGNVGSRA